MQSALQIARFLTRLSLIKACTLVNNPAFFFRELVGRRRLSHDSQAENENQLLYIFAGRG